MLYCHMCGKLQSDENARFCEECGAKLQGEEPAPVDKQEETPKPKKKAAPVDSFYEQGRSGGQGGWDNRNWGKDEWKKDDWKKDDWKKDDWKKDDWKKDDWKSPETDGPTIGPRHASYEEPEYDDWEEEEGHDKKKTIILGILIGLAAIALIACIVAGVMLKRSSSTSPGVGNGDAGSGGEPGSGVVVIETNAPEDVVEVKVDPAVPEMQTPETAAPETNAPETAAPETNAPETTAPETNAPETTAPETTAPETQAPETPAPLEEQYIYGYEGSYISSSSSSVEFHVGEVSGSAVSVTSRTVLYVDVAIESGGQIWGHTEYGGMAGYVPMNDLSKVSAEDYSMSESSRCFVNSRNAEGTALFAQSSTGSDILTLIPYGTELQLNRLENGMGYVNYSGQSGWVSLSYVAVFREDLVYTADCEYRDYVTMKQSPADSAAELNTIPNDTPLRVAGFENGWCRTAYKGTTGWVAVADLKPQAAADQVNFAALEAPAQQAAAAGDTSFYKDGTAVASGSYILPDSATRYLSESDLSNLTLKGLCYAKNEIYARYGRKFKSAELTSYFNSQSWYNGIYEAGTDTDTKIVSMMNEYERHNKDLLWSVEQKNGTYDLDTNPGAQTISVETPAAEDSEAGIHRYEIFQMDITWEQAVQVCRDKGGHLIRINSQEEYEYILDELDRLNCEQYRFYIGARRDLDSKLYYWADDSNSLYGEALNGSGGWTESAWMDGEPSYLDSTINQQEHVVEMFFYDDLNRWVWNDVPNNLPDYVPEGQIGYICEYED